MVLDTMEVWSCVPRVPWNVFCCLVCKNIDDTADFWVDDDCVPPAVNRFENTLRELGLTQYNRWGFKVIVSDNQILLFCETVTGC